MLDTNPWIVLLKFFLVSSAVLAIDYAISNPDTVTSALTGIVHLAPFGLLGLRRGLESLFTGVVAGFIGSVFSICCRLLSESEYMNLLAVGCSVTVTAYTMYVLDRYDPGILVPTLFSALYVVLVKFQWVYMAGPVFEDWPELPTFVLRCLCLVTGVLCAFVINIVISSPFQNNIFSARLKYTTRELDKALSALQRNPLSPEAQAVFGLLSSYIRDIDNAEAELRVWSHLPCTRVQEPEKFRATSVEHLRRLVLQLAISLSQDKLSPAQIRVLQDLDSVPQPDFSQRSEISVEP